MGSVWALVLARARAHRAVWTLLALGVALATAGPVLTSASTVVAGGRALEHGLAGLPAGQRSITVSYNGSLSGTELARTDRAVRRELHRLSGAAALRQLEFRRLSDGRGGELTLAAVDGLSRLVRLSSGRLPSSCTPQRCEVVQVGTEPAPHTADLGVVIVGRVERADPLVLSGTFDPGNDAPLLLSANTEQAAALAVLTLFHRSWGWIAPVDVPLVRRLGVDPYLARESAVADELNRQLQGLIVTAPDDVLRTEDARARRSAGRFALLGGTSAALVLGLAVVAAVSIRRDHLGVLRLLRTRGATRAQLAGFSATEAAWPVLAGALAGLLSAYLAALLQWGRPVAGSGLSGGARTAGLLAGVALVAVGATLRWQPRTGERGAWRAVALTAGATFAVVGLAASRGSTAVQPGAPVDPLVSLLPVLTAVGAGLLAACAWPLAPRLLAGLVPPRAAAARLALAGAGRQPLRSAATVAVLAATCCSVVFAGSYRATIDRGAADQAAFSVPMAARLTTGPSLTRPVDVATPGAVARLGPAVAGYPVLRTGATVLLTLVDSAPVELIGLDPGALPRMAHWRPDYSATAPATIARRITTVTVVTGVAIPDGARRLRIPATGSTFAVDVHALVRDRSGRSVRFALFRHGDTLDGDLPAGPGRRLAALELQEDPDTASRRAHATGEGGVDVAARAGRVVLGRPAADGMGLADDLSDWSVSAGSHGTGGAGRLAVDYRLAGNATTLRPPQPVAGTVPAYVDRETARLAHGGVLALDVGQGHKLLIGVVATGERFPTTRRRFAVLDRAALAGALDAAAPGTGTPTEVWIWAPTGAAARAAGRALERSPYDRLAVALRAAREQSLRTDPVAVTSSQLLLGTAAAGLLIGALCIVLLVSGERREAAGEWFAREAAGTRPGRLRVALFARAGAVVAVGVPFGLATGLGLARATTALVTVTAAGTTPTPPLMLAAAPALVALELAALLSVGLAGAAAVAATSLRGSLPVPPETDLR